MLITIIITLTLVVCWQGFYITRMKKVVNILSYELINIERNGRKQNDNNK
jgi:hypothetical protein